MASTIRRPVDSQSHAVMQGNRKGNNALSAAISPAQHGFGRRYARALEEDDKVTLNALDLFRKTSRPTCGSTTS